MQGLRGPIVRALVGSGLVYAVRLFVNVRHAPAVRILSLHRVVDGTGALSDRERADLGRGCLSLEEFRDKIAYLKAHYRFIRFSDYAGYLQGRGRLGSNAVILTCDDGYADIYRNVFPFLLREGIPFTVFVTTGYVGRDREMLDWRMIGELSMHTLIDWGNHTESHRPLTGLEPQDAEREIRQAHETLQRMLGRKIQLFCYPDGKGAGSSRDILKKYGYVAACSTVRGVNDRGVDPFALRRIPFTSESMERFALRMAGRT
jgi:peptidoglycan/xylan/chitin deacetylase (PgdA/CDA1 family)